MLVIVLGCIDDLLEKMGDQLKVLFFNDFGDVLVLQYGEVVDLIVIVNIVLVKIMYIGFNFVDIYCCCGIYYLEKY